MTDSKTYVPPPSKPPKFDERVNAICGLSLSGQPRIRVIWGWDARCFRNGNPDALKYPNPKMLNRWLIEQLVPASFYGTHEEWEAARYAVDDAGKKVDLLGEYPYRGDYILVIPLLDIQTGGYIPCSEEVIKFINIMRIEFESRVNNAFSGAKLKLQMEQQMAADQAELEAEAAKEEEDFDSWFLTNQEKLVTHPEYSKNLWTPHTSTGEKKLVTLN